MRFEPAQPAPPLVVAKQRLLDNPRILKRLVRRVALDDTPEAEAIFTLAAGKQFDYTPASWKVVLDRVDTCELTVGDWLNGLES